MTGQEFKLMRNHLGFSQQRIASELEVSMRTITRIETSKKTVQKVYALAICMLSIGAEDFGKKLIAGKGFSF